MPSCVKVLSLLVLGGTLVRADPTGCPEFTVEQPRPHGGVVVRAADFGFSATNTDNAAAINRAIAECRRVKADRLELAAGTYACNGAIGVELDGLEDCVLDGRNALLVFWRKHPRDWDAKMGGPVGAGSSFSVRNCTRVRVENIRMDWDWAKHPLGFFARCVNKHVDERDNESYVDFEIPDMDHYPLYPSPVPIQLIQPMNETRDNARLGGGGGALLLRHEPWAFRLQKRMVVADTVARVGLCQAAGPSAVPRRRGEVHAPGESWCSEWL